MKKLLLSLIYIGGFFLLLEWLWPLGILTNTQNTGVFYLYAAFCFFLAFMQVRWYIAVPLKLLGLIFILDGLFIPERIFSSGWWSILYEQLMFNAEAVWAQEWWNFTAFFRSLLFLVLLWLVSYLLHYWLVIARRALFFIILTFVYITVIDTFTPYEAQGAIVRTFVLAAFVLGLLQLEKEVSDDDRKEIKWKTAILALAPLLGAVLLAVAAGTALPKFSPQWPDPVPYLENVTGGAGTGDGEGGVQKVGYGENDSRLGGAFVQDDTLVFQAIVEDRQYWRAESKDQYTGKGWEDTLEEPVTGRDPGAIGYSLFEKGVETDPSQGFIDFTEEADFGKLLYPYGMTAIGNLENPLEIDLHTQTGEMETRSGGDSVQPASYSFDYGAPAFDLRQLREAGGEDPVSVREKYLQLPSSVTERTKELASEVVSEYGNRYDKAKAVESYFSSNGFEYSTTDVEVPEAEEDYVDQFVFETKKGYCDNYSTSMVVMLRAEGIPARWVKGFTGGEIKETDAELFGENLNAYDITSANAHSWVEVYFPDIGWVPFEPTQGFTNNADFTSGTDTDSGEPERSEESPEVEAPDQQQEGNPQQIGEEEGTEDSAENGRGEGFLRNLLWWIVPAVILVLPAVLYVTRLRWLSWYHGRRLAKNETPDSFQAAYRHLLVVLDKKVQKRGEGETLRTYAKAIDRRFETVDMQHLTTQYERLVYRKEQRLQRTGLSELWENLIKKALS